MCLSYLAAKFGQQIFEWASKDRDSDTHRKTESSQLYRSRTTWWQSKGQRAELKTLDLLPAFSRWFNFVAHVVNSTEVKKATEKECLEKIETRRGEDVVWRQLQ